MGVKEVKIEIVEGVEGNSVYINDHRVCGNKPWGGGTAIGSWKVSLKEITQTLALLDVEPSDFRKNADERIKLANKILQSKRTEQETLNFIETLLKIIKEACDIIDQQHAENKQLREETCPSWMGKDKGCNEAKDYDKLEVEVNQLEEQVEPVRDWYDEARERDLGNIIKDIVLDLQKDRKDVLSLQAKNKRLKAALSTYGNHKNNCAYVQGLKGNTIEDCDCGFEQTTKGVEKTDVFEIYIPNLRPDEVQYTRAETKKFTQELLNKLTEQRKQRN